MKRFFLFILVLSVPFLFLGCSQGPEYKEKRDLTLPAAGLDTLELVSGTGDVGITGNSAVKTVKVSAEIVAKGADSAEVKDLLEKKLTLDLSKRGNRAVLHAYFAKPFFLAGLFTGEPGRVNLNIEVPPSMALSVKNEGGNLYISAMNKDISLTDEGAGNIVMDRITGEISLTDNGGGITLSNISGKTEITDKSGGIEVTSSKGELFIDDTTDEIYVSGYRGPVRISDTVGQITLEDITGDVQLKARGRGDVMLSGVSGNITQNY